MEQWKPILGYEGLYSVSDLGYVRRDLDRTSGRAGAIKALVFDRDGYLQVSLSKPGSELKTFRVHRLVWEAFNGKRPLHLTINHRDGVRTNNRRDNLELLSNGDNVRHSIHVLGHNRRGSTNPSAKLADDEVLAIRQASADGESRASIARRYGVTGQMIALIVTGKAWTHVGGPIVAGLPYDRTPRAIAARVTRERIAEVVARYRAGERAIALAHELGVSKRTIYNWVHGLTRSSG